MIGRQPRSTRTDTIAQHDALPIFLPMHGAGDRGREAAKGDSKVGTTGRGIGPAYEDKVGRRAVRLCDLADPDLLRLRVEGLLVHNNALLRGLGQPEFTADEIVASLLALAPRILPFAEIGRSTRLNSSH